jgi:hypothetical protein
LPGRNTGEQHLLGAEKIFWPVHENRLAIAAAGFSFERSRFGRGGWVCEASPAVEPPVAASGALPQKAGVVPPTRVSASRVPARLSGAQNDPRSVRRLPWALEEGSWRD